MKRNVSNISHKPALPIPVRDKYIYSEVQNCMGYSVAPPMWVSVPQIMEIIKFDLVFEIFMSNQIKIRGSWTLTEGG